MILLRLKLENFRSIKSADIDLSNKNLIGIVGEYIENKIKSNGAGKSSIVESILFILARYNPRTERKTNDVESFIMDGADYVEGTLEFKMNEITYKIIRNLTRKNVETIRFFVDGVEKKYKKTEFKKEIENIIGIKRPQLFTYINFFTENKNSFFEKTPTERINILIKDFLNMDIFKKYRDIIYKKQQSIKDNIKSIEFNLETKIKDTNLLKNQLTELKELDIETKIKNLRKQIQLSTNNKKELEIQINNISNIADKQKQYNTLLEQNNLFLSKKTQIEQNLDKYKKEYNVLQTEINNIKLQIQEDVFLEQQKNIETYQTTLDNLLNKLDAYKQELTANITEQQILKERLTQISSLSGKCPTCGNILTDEHKTKEINNINQELSELAKIQVDINNNNDALNKSITNVQEKLNNVNVFVNNYNQKKQELTLKEQQIISLKDTITNYSNEYNDVTNMLNQLESQINNIKQEIDLTNSKNINLDELKEKITSIDKFILQTQQDIADLNSMQKKIITLEDSIKVNEKNIKESEKDIKKINEQVTISNILYDAFGPNGIPVLLLRELLKFVEHHSNKILMDITNDKYIEFVFDKNDSDNNINISLDFNIVNKKTNTKKVFADLSTGEKVYITFALRMGFSYFLSVQAKPINFVVLDDIMAVLDEYNTEQIIKILYILRNRFKQTFILSHSNIKDIFPHIIKVVKDVDDTAVATISQNKNITKLNEFMSITTNNDK